MHTQHLRQNIQFGATAFPRDPPLVNSTTRSAVQLEAADDVMLGSDDESDDPIDSSLFKFQDVDATESAGAEKAKATGGEQESDADTEDYEDDFVHDLGGEEANQEQQPIHPAKQLDEWLEAEVSLTLHGVEQLLTD